MPKVFSKDTQINVVEYGEHSCFKQDMRTMKMAVLSFFKGLLAR